MEKERLGSRLGFILLSAGCAIGVGNVWKFPWLAGMNGGGAFVLVYIFFLIILGLPVMTMEFSLGRASQKSPVKLYQELEPKGSCWHIHGYVSLVGNIVLMMFYTTVCGWMLYYFISTTMGLFQNMTPEQVGAAFGSLLSDPKTLIKYMLISTFAGFFVLSFNLNKGLERVTKYLMTFLMLIMVIMAFHSFTMKGTSEGLSFYLLPDFSKINWDVVVAAMNQAFFTLSIGMGSMAIFGSYIGKEHSLFGESINIIALDTFVALVSGLIIFPACFTYNVEPGAGPGLIFVTLPNIFNNMPYGRIWGSLFFVFMTFAAFSTVLAVFETILACVRDLTGWSRSKASIICFVAIAILSLPCPLGFSAWSSFQPLGKGTCVMDLEDFIVSNCILPLGSLTFVLFCTWSKFGWDRFMSEANTGKGPKLPNWLFGYCKYVLPIIILSIFIIGIIPFLKK